MVSFVHRQINQPLHESKMRYFLELAYNGTRFSGWQRQPNALSVQERIEDVFSLILRQPIELFGCGRTDTGVHARYYVAHFDFEGSFPESFLQRANKMVGKDIVLKNINPVHAEAHARFDAYHRSYEYHISFVKNPFTIETEWFFSLHNALNINDLQKTAEILRGYEDFAPFCKTNSDAKTMKCQINRLEWVFEGDKAVLHISANRFLRGMVRLIVGACVNVGLGQLSLEDLKKAMDDQSFLKKSYSVPPTGLFLTEVKYFLVKGEK
jgi:tRNA pseudouridine38-40 synthase